MPVPHPEPFKLSATKPPATDPTPIFELFRGNYGTELLTAAVTHFRIFERWGDRRLTFAEMGAELNLAERAAMVLLTALAAFELLQRAEDGRWQLSALAAEHLRPGAYFDIGAYIGLGAQAPGTRALIERLETNRPAQAAPDHAGAAFIYRAGLESAMEQEASARSLTLALAGRARNVAPLLASRLPLIDHQLMLDVGGGTGIYSMACLQANPRLRAIVWDRPEVLKVAAEMAAAYGVQDRMICQPGDMFLDPVPAGADLILLSNVLHDWDLPHNRALVKRCAASLPLGGRLVVHDVFLNDNLDGPLPVALYSAALFTLTEGRAYSAAEYRGWLTEAGLVPGEVIPTSIHCGLLSSTKTNAQR